MIISEQRFSTSMCGGVGYVKAKLFTAAATYTYTPVGLCLYVFEGMVLTMYRPAGL